MEIISSKEEMIFRNEYEGKVNRKFIGIEIDPEYHKIAVDRLNGITANGQTSIFTNFDNIGSD